jgi:DNA helicase-2/ATP-dependent DNA helicase PcrA
MWRPGEKLGLKGGFLMQNEEILYLERVNKAIDKKISSDKEKLDYYLEQLKIIPDDDENKFSMASVWADTFTNSLDSLNRHKDKPYFARIDFRQENSTIKDNLYIGKLSLIDEKNDCLVIDWRTPIANLYYDSSLGDTSYKTNDGSYINGNLSLKRVYTIENGKLLNYLDVHSTSDDDLLKPFLGVNADNKIKNIVSSIQKEQNEIIRDSLYKNIVVQGVAGSGKTTVMLHRIAYLAYNYQDSYKTNQYLVLSPNKLFTDYISTILPDLEVDKVRQVTYEDIFLTYLNFKFKPILLTRNKGNEYDQISHYKSSKEFINEINKFFYKYEDSLINRDLVYKGIVIIDKDCIKELYSNNQNDCLEIKIKKLMDSIYNISQKDTYRFMNNINTQIKSLDKLYPNNKKEHLNLSYECKQLFIKGMKNLIKDHFKLFNNNIYQLYLNFITTLDNEQVKTSTYNNLIKKKFDYDDLPILIYLKYLINGAKDYDSYISVSIDEAQDLGYTHFLALKKIFRGAYFTIVGDLSQSIYAYRGIEHWSNIDCLFNNNMKYLSKSYRNTIEIMNYANVILRYLQVDEAIPVIRHGNEVNEIKYYDKVKTISERINYYQNNNYKSIAIICKSQKEVDYLYNYLSTSITISKIDEDTTNYNGGICILPIYLAKGLEFDCVILTDVDDNNYNSDNILDMKLLYVGITRALHNLDILYKDNKQNLYK